LENWGQKGENGFQQAQPGQRKGKTQTKKKKEKKNVKGFWDNNILGRQELTIESRGKG